MKVAFYKGTRSGISGLFNMAVRWWLSIPYSHVELLLENGESWSCSLAAKGVRKKRIEYSPEKWDIIDVPSEFKEEDAVRWFTENEGKVNYSILLLVAFVIPVFLHLVPNDREVCCTSIAKALNIPEHRRYDPFELKLFLEKYRSARLV